MEDIWNTGCWETVEAAPAESCSRENNPVQRIRSYGILFGPTGSDGTGLYPESWANG